MAKSRRFEALLDVDDLPLAFVQTSSPYISVGRYRDDAVAWRTHRTASGARRAARQDRTIACRFDGVVGRWEPLPAEEVTRG